MGQFWSQLVFNQIGARILTDPGPMPSICSQWEEWSGIEGELIIGRVFFGFTHRVEWMSWASGLHPVHYRVNNNNKK